MYDSHAHRNQHPIHSDDSTSSSPPPLIEDSSDEDDPYDHHLEISDDTRNAIHRRYAQLQTRLHLTYSNPPRLLAVAHTVSDIRTATNDSDSTPIYPDPSDSSDGDTPQYWTENTNPTPPPSNSLPPVRITDRQLMEWIESQLPWNIFRQTIPIFRDTPIELCGPPRLQRDLPNRTHMYAQAAPYADTLDSFNRISASYTAVYPGPTTSRPYLQSSGNSTSICRLHTVTTSKTPPIDPPRPPVLSPTRRRHPDPEVAQTPPHL